MAKSGETNRNRTEEKKIITPGNSAIVTFLGWLSDPFRWLSDLQLGDEKVTKNHLAKDCLEQIIFLLVVDPLESAQDCQRLLPPASSL